MVAETRHTWLFEPGHWIAEGLFWEGGEIERAARGTSTVRHGDERWEIEGVMEILGETPVRFENTYSVDRPDPGSGVVRWRLANPATGTLTGVFAVAGDAILSLFRSEDRAYAGSECLTLLAPDRYRARGLFTSAADRRVISSWSVELVRDR